MEWNTHEHDYGKNISEISVVHGPILEIPSDDDFGSRDFFVHDERGYSHVLDEMVKEMS